MRRRDKEIIEIGECASLASGTSQPAERCGRPPSPRTLRLRARIGGNDYFGWRLTISFLLELTPRRMSVCVRCTRCFPWGGAEGQP